MPPPPPVLLDELMEEVFFRLPPDEPENLFRASSVCKPWRGILADPGFRRRYREFHGTPPVLGLLHNTLGESHCHSRFVPTSAFHPAETDIPSWSAMDCRHGRALFFDSILDNEGSFEFIVLDPMTGDESRVPWPDHMTLTAGFGVAVLCAAEGCDHQGCQGRGPFRVALVSTAWVTKVTSACLYSSETGLWSELTSVYHLNACVQNMPSVLVGDALYFSSTGHIFKYELATLDLSVFEMPIMHTGSLVTVEDGELGFANVNGTTLTLWSRETGPDGAMGWAKHRVIDLVTLLPDGALSVPTLSLSSRPFITHVHGFIDGTQVIFLGTHVGVYMVELKSGRAKKVLEQLGAFRRVFPYVSFCIPAMEADSTGQGQ